MDTNSMITVSNLASFAKLQRLVDARNVEGTAEAGMTFEDFEVALSRAARNLESELKSADLARYDVEAEVVVVEGKQWRRCLEKEPKTYLSSSGPLVVPRNLYRPVGGGKSICPLELRAGIMGGCFTPVLARQVWYMMGHMTSVETSKLFDELGINGPSSSSCDRLPKQLSSVWEANREQWEDALRQREVVPGEAAVLGVSLDGVMVPDKDAKREAKAKRESAKKQGLSKQLSGPAGYREVGCATVTLYDDDANRIETVRYGREPEPKKKTLTEQLDAEVSSILATRPDLELVAIADGAEENWRYFSQPIYEQATKIVDNGHACEHLRDAMAAYYGKKNVEGRAEYERWRIILRDKLGGVDLLIEELARLERKMKGKRKKTRRKSLHAELKYFRNQRARMDYADYQIRGLPIGSGLVEAACKTLATQRLKRSGMSWRDGKQAMLTIRSLQQSNRWPAAWDFVSSHFRADVFEVRMHGHLREITPAQMAA